MEDVEQKEKKLRVRSARDIFDALGSGDFAVRLSILKAIANNPGKASSYGPYNGRELLDELITLWRDSGDSGFKLAVLTTMSVFRDMRLVRIFKSEMSRAGDTQTMLIAASRLADEPEDDMRDFMAKMLWRDTPTEHARVAANIMAKYKNLEPDERVRIAVYCDITFPTPPLDDTTEAAWLKELEGPRDDRARALVESLGEEAFLRLRDKWDALSEDLRKWMLGWGAKEHPVYTVELVANILRDGPEGLLIPALQATAEMGEAGALFRDLISGYAAHQDNAVRLAALRADAPVEDVTSMLSEEQDDEIRLELISALVREKGEGAVDELVSLLDDKSWRIRAGATEGLVRIGKPAVEAVKPLVGKVDEKARLAAVQILVALGENQWLEETLVSNQD